MAQDVALWGVAYTDVPEVRVPKQGGGMAAFHDVSDTTAAAADVAQGKLFHAADGTLTTGTASGGGGDDGSFKAVIERSGNVTSLPADLTMVGTYAFYGCKNLTLTSLPSGVTYIAPHAFDGCTGLELTSLPSGVVEIGAAAFQMCTGLVRMNLPSSMVTIGSSAFHNCSNLETVFCDGPITDLTNGAFTGNSSYPMKLSSAEFPNLMMSSFGTAFGNATASSACQHLAFVDLGNIKGISTYAFQNCYSLTTIVLRRSDAICTLANLNALTNTPMRGYNSQTGTVYVPQALISTYKTATNWKTLYNNGTVTFAAIEGSPYELS